MSGKERTDAVWRDVHRGRVWRAQACRIVEDSEDTIALWIPAGAPAKVPVGGLRIPGEEWELEDTAPTRPQLCVARRGRRHSIYVFWDDSGAVDHWYVNFEQPLRRTPLGVDTFDEKLDLIVLPGGSYVWKDEHELDQAAAAGLLDAEAVRAEASRVLEEWPFPTGWEDWRPDPSWPVPQLPRAGMWSRGDHVLLRYVNAGRVSRVLPMTVVADDERTTQLFIPIGTRTRTRHHLDGTPVSRSLPYAERFARPWVLGEGTWVDFNDLMLTPTGAAHSIWAIWDESWRFLQWYVNLQDPLRRTRFGFDTADHVLDLVIDPDLTWRWKDEDELAEAIRLGRFTRAEADELYREGERVLGTLASRAWPFDRDWGEWRPDPAWPTPTFVEGCDEL